MGKPLYLSVAFGKKQHEDIRGGTGKSERGTEVFDGQLLFSCEMDRFLLQAYMNANVAVFFGKDQECGWWPKIENAY